MVSMFVNLPLSNRNDIKLSPKNIMKIIDGTEKKITSDIMSLTFLYLLEAFSSSEYSVKK